MMVTARAMLMRAVIVKSPFISKQIRPMGVLFALGIAAVLACNGGHDEEDDNQFREDVIWCEEAVARLERCCPTFDPQKVLCNFYYSFDQGCGSSTTTSINPALSKTDSQCIRDTTCDEIVAKDMCARAEAAGAANSKSPNTFTTDPISSPSSSSSSSATSTPPQTAQVCP